VKVNTLVTSFDVDDGRPPELHTFSKLGLRHLPLFSYAPQLTPEAYVDGLHRFSVGSFRQNVNNTDLSVDVTLSRCQAGW
jgi:hypothetical protein